MPKSETNHLILREKLTETSIACLAKKSILANDFFSNYEEIKANPNIDEKVLKTFYVNKERIHNFLYNKQETINLDSIIENKKKSETKTKLSELFYVDLLIKYEPDVLDYEFSIQSIVVLCKELQTIKEGLKKIILSRIIIDLIESYKGIGKYTDLIKEKNLNVLSENCKKVIKIAFNNEKKLFSNFKFEDMIEKSIDILYIEIIKRLLNTDLFSIDSIYKSLDAMELENINITEKMYKNFIDFLNSDNNILEKYCIEKIDDLINIKKINLYYIILKYILKEEILIYEISFLLKTRKLIIEIITRNLYELLAITADLDDKTREKLEYVIKFISDVGYYFEKYTLLKNDSKEIINNQKLRYSFPLIRILINNDINDVEKISESVLKQWDECNNLIKEKKYKKIKSDKMKKLLPYFKDENNKALLLKLYDDKLYEFYHDLSFDEKVILENSEVECVQMSNYVSLPKEISLPRINDSSSMIIQSYTVKDISVLKEVDISCAYENPILTKYDLNLFKKSDKYKFIEHYKILETNNVRDSNYQIMRILSKGHYITGLNNTRLILYNSNFEKKLEIYLFDRLRNVYELENDSDIQEDEIHLLACLWNKIVLVKINIQKYTYLHHDIYEGRYNLLIQEKDKYLIIDKKGGYKLNAPDFKSKKRVLNDTFTGGVKIKNNLYALTNNDVFQEDQNKLVIYDFSKNQILKQYDDYTMDYSSKNPYVLNKNKNERVNEEKQVLICTCKKENKNGFLLLNINSEKNENQFSEYFYDTKEFEPNCYCQLLNVENNNSIYDDITNENNIIISNTDYFLVGGFDPEKRMGVIKLYKMIYDRENNIKIKFLFDLDIQNEENDFKGFDMKVISIQQSKTTGNLMISCLDGTVSLFKPPNFECL